MGANAGSKKCWFACRPAIARPLSEKIKVAIRFKRSRRMVSIVCASEKPGAIPSWLVTKGRAKIAITIAARAVRINAILRIFENRSQALVLPSLDSTSVRTGINAIASAPPEISMKSISGRLFAALKTSSWAESPNSREIIIWRATPRTLSIPNKTASNKDTLDNLLNFFISLQISRHNYATTLQSQKPRLSAYRLPKTEYAKSGPPDHKAFAFQCILCFIIVERKKTYDRYE